MKLYDIRRGDAVRFYMSVPAGFHRPIRPDSHGHRPRSTPDLPRLEDRSLPRTKLHAATDLPDGMLEPGAA